MTKHLLYFLLFAMYGSTASSQWTGTPANGTPVCTAIDFQNPTASVTDGSGGAIIFWRDYRNEYGIRYNRINNNGYLVWSSASAGLELYNSDKYLYVEDVVADGSGGAFVLFSEENPVTYSADILLLQHISSSGTKLIAGNGVLVTTTVSGDESYLCADNTGGVVVVWGDGKEDPTDERPRGFCQRFSSVGAPLWTPASGVKIMNNSAVNDWDFPVGIVRDASNNFFIGAIDTRNSNYEEIVEEYDNIDIYAQKLDLNGNKLWGAGGKPVCANGSNQFAYSWRNAQTLVSDGAGGLIMAWEDYRNDPDNANGSSDNSDIFIQRLNANGDALWVANGIAACTASDYQGDIGMMPAPGGGALVWWYDDRTGSYRIYAQSFSGTGTPAFTNNGRVILANFWDAEITYTPDLQALIIAIESESYDISFQRLDATTLNSTLAMAAPVANSSDGERGAILVPNSAGRAIIVYERVDNIYATSIGADGILPVQLVEFDAVWKEGDAQLSWRTAQEANSSHFVVQRSTNGNEFIDAGQVTAAGQSATPRNYTYTDPVSKMGYAAGSTIYYRLQMVDKDRQKAYSAVRKLTLPNTITTSAKILGNPIGSALVFSIQSPEKQRVSWQVLDAWGRVFATNSSYLSQGENIIKISSGGWAKGAYHIIVNTTSGNQIIRFVK